MAISVIFIIVAKAEFALVEISPFIQMHPNIFVNKKKLKLPETVTIQKIDPSMNADWVLLTKTGWRFSASGLYPSNLFGGPTEIIASVTLSVCQSVCYRLNAYISETNGPTLLIFWSEARS